MSVALKGHLDLLLVAALRTGPADGYAIIARLKRFGGGTFDLPEATIYPALYRLERQGLIASEWADVGGRRRRVYRLTRRGRRVREGEGVAQLRVGRDRCLGGRHVNVPQTITAYLAAFNEALEVGLRSQRRILWEVTEHVRQAAEEQVRRGVSPPEAEWAATAAFGAPKEVAARLKRD